MTRCYRTYWLAYYVFLGTLLWLGVGVDSAYADVSEAEALDWLRGIGFPAWAVVLLVVGNRVVSAIHEFFTTLNRHVTQTERRLARLEALVFLRHGPPFTDAPAAGEDE